MTKPICGKQLRLAVLRDSLSSIFQSGDLGRYSETFSNYIFQTREEKEFIAQTDYLLKTDTSLFRGRPIPQVNTDNSEETNPVLDGKERLYFTRSGPTTLLGSEDIFIWNREPGTNSVTPLPRPINDAHENSLLFLDGDTLYVYGQYDSRKRYFVTLGSMQLTIPTFIVNHPNGFPRYSNYVYAYDPLADFPSAELLLYYPVSKMLNEREYKRIELLSSASGSSDSRGGVFVFWRNEMNNYRYQRQLESPINTSYWDSDLFFSKNKKVAFISSDKTSNDCLVGNKLSARKSNPYIMAGNTDLFLIDSAWIGTDSQYVFDYPINTVLSERTPSLSFGEDTLFFASNGLPGYGGFDIYYCVKVRDSSFKYWTKPRNLGPLVNSNGDELWFRQSDDGQFVYSSNKGGTFDIYEAITADRFVQSHTKQTCGDWREHKAYFKREEDRTETLHIMYEEFLDTADSVRSQRQINMPIDRTFDADCVEQNGLTDKEIFHNSCALKQATSLSHQTTEVYISDCETDKSIINLIRIISSAIEFDKESRVMIEFSDNRRIDADLITDVLSKHGIKYDMMKVDLGHLLIKY
ncbi:MAG: PD40 domain-containing protein [Ignavibacteria bacterium]|nr:PD40 domain-containing protein [Ignavibacteria bacterium]